MDFDGQQSLEDALGALGAVLEARGLEYSMVAVGGGSLLLLGLLQRPTKDLDIVAVAGRTGYERSSPLPEPFALAVRDTARVMGLAEDWVNPGPASLLDFGLPPGFETRLEERRFGSLDLRLLGRGDQIALKLYAAVDQGPSSKHTADLRRLAATGPELLAGARWALGHDPSPGFRQTLVQALAAFGVEARDADL
jgi:hypothetical protein